MMNSGQNSPLAEAEARRLSTQHNHTFPARSELSQMNVIALLEAALREKDDIIQAQYAELASTRERLALAVRLLNEAPAVIVTPPTSSNLGHG